MHIDKDIVPFPIQPRFVGIDAESGYEWYTVDYVGYRMSNSGIDYSNYWENMSQSALILLINPKTKEIKEYYLEYYDENDEYVGDYDVKIGDEIESYFLGFRVGQEDIEYFFSLEDITPVTSPLTFSYKEAYPGKDFNCTFCGELNLLDVEFKYIFESYTETRSNFTQAKPITKTVNNSNTSSSNAVPLSGFWIFLLLTLLIRIRQPIEDR